MSSKNQTKAQERIAEGALVGGALGSPLGPEGTVVGAAVGVSGEVLYHIYDVSGVKNTVCQEFKSAQKSVRKKLKL